MHKQITHHKSVNEKLAHEIALLKRFKFAKRSEQLSVSACNRNGFDLQSSRFSTGIVCVYPSQQTGNICE
ncbi:putative transposase [Pseudomonas syringae pv. coriandricola]|nr:hypothetical protein [Pseudomonas syringae group genomosp. 3]RMR31758.1 hypothetical protein ALP87_200131 [Pseudomonas syringae pv. coriandricola]RMU08530.1 putative transposase [Pseudomonas syringae pv. coriandricola]